PIIFVRARPVSEAGDSKRRSGRCDASPAPVVHSMRAKAEVATPTTNASRHRTAPHTQVIAFSQSSQLATPPTIHHFLARLPRLINMQSVKSNHPLSTHRTQARAMRALRLDATYTVAF